MSGGMEITPPPSVPVPPSVAPDAETPERTDTTYIVLAKYDPNGDTEPDHMQFWQIVATDVPARSAEAAWKGYAEQNMATLGENGTVFVVVPSRSWKPSPAVKQKVVLELGE